jgi:hypothetical protein
MTAPRCCRNLDNNVAQKRGARKATRLDHPRYVEAANQAKADYIRAREDQMSHAAACAGAVTA